MQNYWTVVHPWLWSIGILVGLVVLALIGHWLLFSVAARVARTTGRHFDDYVLRRARAPAQLFIPLLVTSFALPELPLPPATAQLIERVEAIGMIAVLAWMVIAILHVAEDVITARYRTDTPITWLRAACGRRSPCFDASAPASSGLSQPLSFS